MRTAIVWLMILTSGWCKTFRGIASWYGKKFSGKEMTDGKKFNPNQYTAAHLTLPFGTKILITNLKNHKKVIVTITDRGPHVKGRILDISRAAAEKLGMIGMGIAPVEFVVLRCDKKVACSH